MNTFEERFKKTVEAIHEKKIGYYSISLSLEDTSLLDSKVGGLPYIPENGTIPLAKESKMPLRFLAQINIGHLFGSIFPHATGILQFWISDDDVYGMDTNNYVSQDKFRVIYHKSVRACLSVSEIGEKFTSLREKIGSGFPISEDDCFKMTAVKGVSRLSCTDFHHDPLFVEKYNQFFPEMPIKAITDVIYELDEDIVDTFLEDNGGHKVLGYPDFTQTDPREENFSDYILLFQLDSESVEGGGEILWGDCGIGNWFILPEDLEKGDFSKVLFHWDCC